MIKTIAFPLLLLVMISLSGFSVEYSFSGSRSLGLSNANVTLSDVWSANNNQAGLASLKDFSVGIHFENRFGLRELGLKNVNVALPTKWGVFGFSAQQFGFSEYSEYKFGLGFGKKLSRNIRLGIQLNYLFIPIAEAQTDNKQAVTAEIGLQADLVKNLQLGVHIYNFTNSQMTGEFQEQVPLILRIGLKYEFSKKLFMVLDIEKNIDRDAILKTAIEYRPIDQLFFRGGVQSLSKSPNSVALSAGIGLELKNFTLDFGFSNQSYIGNYTSLSLVFSLPKK
jgi:hypothetical protein